MGCWNGTCAISKLPIFHGDRVIVWFFNSARYSDNGKVPQASSYCYPWGQYSLLGVPFRAEYNDYGWIEDIDEADTVMLQMVIEELRSNLVEIEQGENEYHDIEVKKRDLDIELIGEAIHENRLRITGWGENVASVGIMMVHEHLFEHMIANTRWTDWTWPDGYNGKSVKITQQYNVDAMVQKMAEIINSEKTKARSRFFRSDALDRYTREITFARDILTEFMDSNVPTYDPNFQKFLKGLAYNNILMEMMSEMRMGIGPQSGAGSQQGEYHQYEALIAAMQSTMAKTKEDRGWDDEDEEE
jgi:hypothetical protein